MLDNSEDSLERHRYVDYLKVARITDVVRATNSTVSPTRHAVIVCSMVALNVALMVFEDPVEGRCNAEVFDKIGLEVHADGYEHVFTDENIESVRLERDDETKYKDPEYDEVIPYMREGFSLTAVNLTRSEATEEFGEVEDDSVVVAIEDDDPYVTNSGKHVKGYCERHPMDCGRCYNHGGNSTGPGEGNMNGVKHGLKVTKLSGYYQNELDQDEKALVHELADSWVEDAPFDRDNKAKMTMLLRIAIDQVRLWKAQDWFEQNDFVDEFQIDFDPEAGEITALDENPANLPYSRLDRDNLKKLKDLGITDDADSKQAEATESLAQKFAEVAIEDE